MHEQQALTSNRISTLPSFGVIALSSFLHFELCLGHNSDLIRCGWTDGQTDGQSVNCILSLSGA